ncbi:hypothetical protein [Micromonospora marina]|uniref:hypothetical protein n=1 Tax=Micromonospora marina TaxID=307120 RepID=UPI003D756EE9
MPLIRVRLAAGPVGQKIVVTAADESPTIEFRRSARRQIARLVIVLLVGGAVGVVFNLARGRQWWDGMLMLPLCLAVLIFSDRFARPMGNGYRSRLPIRLTGEHLQVAGPGDITLSIDWPNIARAEIRGGLVAFLVIEPVDPDQARPAMRRWQWAGHGQSRPYEIVVPLAYMTPGRDLLRRELSRRTAAADRHAV